MSDEMTRDEMVSLINRQKARIESLEEAYSVLELMIIKSKQFTEEDFLEAEKEVKAQETERKKVSHEPTNERRIRGVQS